MQKWQNLSEYLSEEFVLIRSPFLETTRNGKYLQSVNIAPTSRTLLITSSHDGIINLAQDEKASQVTCYCPLENTKLMIFKKSRRQSIKVCLNTFSTKYFELGQSRQRKIIWKLWCLHVGELNGERKTWPFVNFQSEHRCKKNHVLWTNKYLYLGSRRAIEDNDRPKPVPGLGPTEDIKLLYLKPKYFGCWDQSEHWVQCGNSASSVDD